MTRNAVAGLREHHCPRHACCAAPQFAVDEVAQAPERQAQRHRRRDEIHHPPKPELAAACEPPHGRKDTQKAAVERHSPLPQGRDFRQMFEVVTRFVEQHVTQAPADDDADHTEKKHVVDHARVPAQLRQPARAQAAQRDERDKRGQIHKAVPADRERTDGQRDGIEIRVGQHGSSVRRARVLAPARCVMNTIVPQVRQSAATRPRDCRAARPGRFPVPAARLAGAGRPHPGV